MKLLKALILFAIIITISQTTVYAQLSYAEGGPAVEDPGLEVDLELRRYVDAINGNDSNDGKTQTAAWKSLSKVTGEKQSFSPGFHILFKRGQSWVGELSFRGHSGGSANKRIVIGAYGNLADDRPKISGMISISTYFMVRDMQSSRIAANDSHHLIIYNNIVFGGNGNGIKVKGECEYTSVVGNLIYDVDNNDCITLHNNNSVTPELFMKSHHWVLDNITIGNGGMEDGIDAVLGDYSLAGLPLEGDIKIIGNRCQVDAVQGISTRTGSGQKAINLGHEGRYHWVIGNTNSGGTDQGIFIAPGKFETKVSGNIFFKGNVTNLCMLEGPGILMKHNTIYDYHGLSTPIVLNSKNSIFSKNIILRPEGGYWAQKLITPIDMDYNWWGHSETPIIDGKSLIDWQTATGFDKNSDAGVVSGVTAPPNDAYNHDPRNWRDQAFLDQFIPSSDFVGLDGVIPGAFDKNGKRQGMAILPFEDSDLENGGLGWEGPFIVQQRLKELGISWGEPLLAKYPSPKDKSINIGLNTDLSWEAGESTISHNVYIGTKPDSLIFMGNQNDTIFNPGTLVYETVYYWRVDQVTSDRTVPGTLWSFTTKEEPIPPAPAENPKPIDGSVDERTSLLFSWDPGKRTRSVKIYLSTVNPPPFVKNQEGNSYNVSGLELSTKYYWRIDGVNEWGETQGEVWSFTTKSVPDLPEGWVGLDIGNVGKNGDDSFAGNSFTITASGKGIKDQADLFRYVSHTLSGDGEIIARVVSLDNTNPLAMAGVMMRGKLDSVSNYSLSALTPESGIRAQWRLFESGLTNSKVGSSVVPPYWVKLVRAGDYIVSYESANGETWKSLKTEKITMSSNAYIGMAVTSGSNNSLCTAVFDNVSINGVIVSMEDDQIESIIPKEFAIGNYPNPFNPTTTIKYDLPKHGNVKIQIYDILGSLVEELVNSKQNAGSHSVIWDGKNSQGVQAASGIYLYRVQYNHQIKSAKMILIK